MTSNRGNVSGSNEKSLQQFVLFQQVRLGYLQRQLSEQEEHYRLVFEYSRQKEEMKSRLQADLIANQAGQIIQLQNDLSQQQKSSEELVRNQQESIRIEYDKNFAEYGQIILRLQSLVAHQDKIIRYLRGEVEKLLRAITQELEKTTLRHADRHPSETFLFSPGVSAVYWDPTAVERHFVFVLGSQQVYYLPEFPNIKRMVPAQIPFKAQYGDTVHCVPSNEWHPSTQRLVVILPKPMSSQGRFFGDSATAQPVINNNYRPKLP